MCLPRVDLRSVSFGGLCVSPNTAAGRRVRAVRGIVSRGRVVGTTLFVLAGLIGLTGCSSSSGSGSGGAPPVTNQHYVSLSWQPSPSVVVGYYVYRGASPDTLSKLTGVIDTETSYTDYSVSSGQTYVYAVTAVDSEGVESATSNTVTVTIPDDESSLQDPSRDDHEAGDRDEAGVNRH